ncbi:hypothetical protein Y032_0072g647 [Ancylostoma ceylanicum]|uniref:Uncharacterized protein n=1 Tax=Ancylostoma ceylanicum TaxID=53326 RepID=A0A016TW23_9BILA|nr:hypothetical protein Y032_0072g647 [Ancylostoma ceylanicum]
MTGSSMSNVSPDRFYESLPDFGRSLTQGKRHFVEGEFHLATLQKNDCYDRQRLSMPNTTRPPPSLKTDNSDNTFHASLSVLENATQNSAAAYTASWVSSTSSIPPELRDEPEVPSFNGSAHGGFVSNFSFIGVS